MRIRYTRRAFLERETIYEYLEERSPRGAANVRRAIVGAIRALEAFPGLGRLTSLPGIRELVVPNYPYKIYYRVEGEDIWLLHIRDARRRPWPAP